jgi:hypothetical protein
MLAQRVRGGIQSKRKLHASQWPLHRFVRCELPCLLPYSSLMSYGRAQVSFTRRGRSWTQSASLTPPG